MTVTPHRQLFSNNHKTTATAHRSATRPLISLTMPLPGVDPLVALAELAADYPQYFYWEQGNRAVAAFGMASARSICAVTNGGVNRFTAAQEFLNQVSNGRSASGFQPLIYCYFPFAAAPLDYNQPFGESYLCLPRWQIERRGDSSFLVVNASTTPETLMVEIETMRSRLQPLAERSLSKVVHQKPWVEEQTDGLEASLALGHCASAIDLALESIQRQEIQKIVLAQTQHLIAPQDFSVPRSLANLRHHYPDCYTFAVSDGRGHCFLGASPERLLSVQHRQLTCDTLAGSAPRGQTTTLDQELAEALLTNPKEQHEHRLVRDFIVDRLRNLGLQPSWSDIPQLLRLTNIQHVWTPIQAQLPAHLSPLEILAALHPTPAVAGIPQALACQKIQEYEQTDRGLYAAPLGWLDLNGDCELVVGIRSALIGGNRARLYAGAGIVAGSETQREVAEIQLKFQPLYRALSI
jgi:menaquinone-specific isochorismate synthase